LLLKVLIGFTVGTLIGLTGLGGGVLLLPMLIFGLHISRHHCRRQRRTVQLLHQDSRQHHALGQRHGAEKVVLAMAVGSIPGSYLGVTFAGASAPRLRRRASTISSSRRWDCCWSLIPALLLFQGRIEDHLAGRQPTMKSFAFMSVIGLVGGFLVGITSVGSGSIIMMLLLLFYSFPPKDHGRHRHCPCRDSDRRHQPVALAGRQRRPTWSEPC
jgi:uncharacterized protein